MKFIVLSAVLFLGLSSYAQAQCVDLSGSYSKGSYFVEKIEQNGCDEITYVWFQNKKEILRVTKKANGVMSSNPPVQNEYALVKLENDHVYYVVVNAGREGFSEGRDYKLPNGDLKRVSTLYTSEGVKEYVDIIPMIH